MALAITEVHVGKQTTEMPKGTKIRQQSINRQIDIKHEQIWIDNKLIAQTNRQQSHRLTASTNKQTTKPD